MAREASLMWRAFGRTLFATYGPGDDRPDVLIGLMDTPELAAEAVRSHNDRLAAVLAAVAGKGEG